MNYGSGGMDVAPMTADITAVAARRNRWELLEIGTNQVQGLGVPTSRAERCCREMVRSLPSGGRSSAVSVQPRRDAGSATHAAGVNGPAAHHTVVPDADVFPMQVSRRIAMSGNQQQGTSKVLSFVPL